tara:strand:- start:1498 stop:3072 length:1575 start_codon:yes stop_codon:yes gene_type:complete
MKKVLFTCCFILAYTFVDAQKTRVYFKDKGEQLSLLNEATKVLSPASLARRQRHNIPLRENDLPVSQEYIAQLEMLGAKIEGRSRWFNYALVEHPNPIVLTTLPFVEKLESPKQYKLHLSGTSSTYDYGFSRDQVEMLKGDLMHARGYTGRGVTIAVIDAGFTGVLQAAVLDSLRNEGRILGSYNFISKDTNVYIGGGSHGASVLSTMAANADSVFMGTAPHANYWLLTSENIASETPVEMDDWLFAAEFADSVGADVINSSLGYSTFDDSADNFSYSDMDGNTALVTQAADMAAGKGIVVVVSAGNEGSSSWQYISAPADGDSVLAVGAVDFQENYVGFSSRGPSADNRIKPDVAAMGLATTLINFNGDVRSGSGTSFSSPLVAGMVACLIQAQPTRSVAEIVDQVKRSAHQYWTPDNLLGYGIPNFDQAYIIGLDDMAEQKIASFSVFPNPFKDKLNINFSGEQEAVHAHLKVLDPSGKILLEKEHRFSVESNLSLELDLASGIYYLNIETDQGSFSQLIKH